MVKTLVFAGEDGRKIFAQSYCRDKNSADAGRRSENGSDMQKKKSSRFLLRDGKILLDKSDQIAYDKKAEGMRTAFFSLPS